LVKAQKIKKKINITGKSAEHVLPNIILIKNQKFKKYIKIVIVKHT